MKILLDAFGGDNSPSEIIKGGIDALNEKQNFTLVLVGKEDIIKEELKKYTFDEKRVEILNADEVITCEEEPTLAVRRKANSSIVVGFKELKENEDAAAFVSAGSTGAYLVGATLRLGRIKGVNRPALSPILPTIDGKNVVLLDSGANADCKPINLVQFAIMGSCYAEVALGIENPRVALLSNGTEDKKGNALNLEVFPILKEMKDINFIGNIEARDVLNGVADVIVTDGFSGNIALKGIEGAIKGLLSIIKKEVNSSVKSKLGGLLLKSNFGRIKNTMDYNKKGGAVFLGVEKTVIKMHGSSKAEAAKNSVLQALDVAEKQTVEKLKSRIANFSMDVPVAE